MCVCFEREHICYLTLVCDDMMTMFADHDVTVYLRTKLLFTKLSLGAMFRIASDANNIVDLPLYCHLTQPHKFLL